LVGIRIAKNRSKEEFRRKTNGNTKRLADSKKRAGIGT
jgi:hypothetical protein